MRSKLEEHRIRDAPLEVLEPGERVRARARSSSSWSTWRTRSRTRARSSCAPSWAPLLITGDYKFDQTPVDGKPADVSRLAELGREGVLCLCGDSTNADRPGVAPSESSVGPALLDLFARCRGRIIVTSFASNVHRVQQVIDAAAQLDRRVALVGRSMRKNFNIASNLGIAEIPDGHADPGPRDRVLPGPQGGRDLDREPGRAAVGACGAWRTPTTRTSSSTPATR